MQTTNATTTAATTTGDSSELRLSPLLLPLLLERAYTKSSQIYRKSNWNIHYYLFLARLKYHDGVYDWLRHSINEVVIATTAFSKKKPKNSAGI